MEKDVSQVTKEIENDLKGKNIDELLYIYFTMEHYAGNFLKKYEEENMKLANDLKDKLDRLTINCGEHQNLKLKMDTIKDQLNEKETILISLVDQKNSLNKEFDKQGILKHLKKELDEKYKQPKDKLIEDVTKSKISLEDFREKFKEVGYNHSYHEILYQKLEELGK